MRKLVAYFSYSGVSKRAAEKLAKEVDADARRMNRRQGLFLRIGLPFM